MRDPEHDHRGVSRALRAQDGEAVRGVVPARRRLRRVRARARDRVPDRRRRPRLLGRDDRDREDRRHRPARRHSDPAASARRAARRRSCATRSRAGRWTARSCASPRRAPSTSPGEVALDYASRARARLDGEAPPRRARGPDARSRRPGEVSLDGSSGHPRHSSPRSGRRSSPASGSTSTTASR